MPLGTEVDLGQGHIALDGDPALPPEMGTAAPPLFGSCLLWPIGLLSQLLLSICQVWCRNFITKFPAESDSKEF